MAGRPLDRDRDRRIAELYASGLNASKVAAIVCSSKETVYRALRREGLKPRRGSAARDCATGRRDDYLAALAGGMTQSQVAKQFGVTKQAVNQAVRGYAAGTNGVLTHQSPS